MSCRSIDWRRAKSTRSDPATGSPQVASADLNPVHFEELHYFQESLLIYFCFSLFWIVNEFYCETLRNFASLLWNFCEIIEIIEILWFGPPVALQEQPTARLGENLPKPTVQLGSPGRFLSARVRIKL